MVFGCPRCLLGCSGRRFPEVAALYVVDISPGAVQSRRVLRCLTTRVIRGQMLSCELCRHFLGVAKPPRAPSHPRPPRPSAKIGRRRLAFRDALATKAAVGERLDVLRRGATQRRSARGHRRALSYTATGGARRRGRVSPRRGAAPATPSADGDLPRGAAAAPLRLGESPPARTPTTPYAGAAQAEWMDGEVIATRRGHDASGRTSASGTRSSATR